MVTFIYDRQGNINAVLDLTEEQRTELSKTFDLKVTQRVMGDGWQDICTATKKPETTFGD